MPTFLFKRPDGGWRINLDYLHPVFLERVLDALHFAHDNGSDFYVTHGHRSFSEQLKLEKAYIAGGPKAAPAGFSAHNYGLAIDVCLDGDLNKPGLQPNWYLGHYGILHRACASAGLAWGGSFGDAPHIGIPGFESKNELRPLYQRWIQQPVNAKEIDKLKAVWDVLHIPA